ncbi:MAG: T9SS type A sorting domain-containing protein [Ignavibacterium sp.]
MKLLLTVFIIWGINYEILSQPLNGSYTIGGSNPDFATLQLAADALNARGVSGPVFFNIRPGTYSKNGGNNSVLVLDSTVAGLSETNKITFQPDAASGGNVDNVILQLNITNTSTADLALVFVSLDYITFRNITFRENDASLNHYNVLVRFQSHSIFNPIIEGVLFEGCRFEGSNSNITKTGIDLDINVKDITIRGNTFIRLANGVINSYFTLASTGYLIIEDNKFLAGYYFAGPTGTTIAVSGEYLYVRRNILDYNGSSTNGFNGILIANAPQTKKVFVEQNLIKGPVSKAMYFSDHIDAQPDSFIIANNMININAFQAWPNESAAGIWVYAKKANVLFNTIRVVGGSFNALIIHDNNCRVFNNIIVAKPSYGLNSAYNQGNNPANLQSDFNSIYIEPSGWPNFLIVRNSVTYYNLLEYQNATGLDSNSTSKNIEFVALDDLHLTECQSQDPEILGIPIQGITNDFDGEIRDAISPLMGADETDTRSNDMFGDPFIFPLPGTAFSIANGKFDNLLADGLAVPDYDNNQVLLFHYNGNKTFTPSGTLQTLWSPTETLFYDVDKDGYLDLIVGFDADRLQIFFGDGAGSFPRDSILLTIGHVRGMTVGIHNYGGNNIERVFLTIDDSNFPPQRSFMGYIDNNYLGRIVVDVLRIPGGSIYPDTIYSVMYDLAMANLDSNPDHEIVALTVGDFGAIYVFNDTTISGTHYSFGTHYRYGGFNTASYTSSSISIADFDADGDNDILTTGYDWDELKLIKNQGNFVFADEVIIARQTRGFVVIDYENDGDKDIVTVNERLEEYGITVYLNDGLGNFTVRENCYFPYADGRPWSIIASDFDLDGRTDIALTSTSDSLYVLYNLGGGTVGIEDQKVEEIPTTFSLEQNFPNPFNPTTTIQYSLPQAEDVTLKIYNLLGEEVKTLVNDYQQAGKHSVQFNSNNLASGIYFYRLQAGSFIQTKKMILIK